MTLVPFPSADVRGSADRDKDVRDPVHGDLALREHEQHIVNTAVFQRLHHIRQLGFAYHVYPGASHNRFQHSLGTMHMTQRIVDALAAKAVATPQVVPSDDEIALVRVAALIHDIGHLPFGHTLEDEVRVFAERHSSSSRLKHFHRVLIDQAACATCTTLIEGAARILRASELDADEYLALLETAAKGNGEAVEVPLEPRRWYLADIVGNTICADLLDYVLRDGYACGLETRFDPKLFRYFTTAEDRTGRTRLALALVKKDKFRIDIVSEIIGVLRMRYTLSERVYHHHAKMAAGAMLARAVELSELTAPAFYEADDSSIFEILEREATRRGGSATPELRTSGAIMHALIGDVRRRKLYKSAFRINTASLQRFVRIHKRKVEDVFGDRVARASLEEEICVAARLPPGSVIVSCPSEAMALKETAVMVLWKGSSRGGRGDAPGEIAEALRDLDERYFDPQLLKEVESLEKKYGALWSLTVFLHPDHYDAAVESVQRFLSERLQVPNDPLLAASIREREGLERDHRIRAQIAPRAFDLQEAVLARTKEIVASASAARTAGGKPPPPISEREASEQAWREVLERSTQEQSTVEVRPPTSRPRRAPTSIRLDERARSSDDS